MIIVCQKCATRLQVDEEKSPARPFNVRCPKCNATVSSGVASPASEHGALAVGGSPSTEHPRFEPNTARAYEPAAKVSTNGETISEDSVRALMELLSKGTNHAPEKPGSRPSWDQRKALVCTAEAYRETVARGLTESGYQVYVAEDTRQAVETMRSNKMDVVLLEPQFDPAEQGSAFVIREINVLRPHPLEDPTWSYVVLAGATLFDGTSFVIGVKSNRYSFTQRLVQVFDTLMDVDFVAQE